MLPPNSARALKGALDNFSLIPPIFFKKSLDFLPLEVYVGTACLILLATLT